MTRGLRAAVPLLLLASVCAGCAGRPTIDRVVLITLDTTRADHLGCYGYARGATASLDRFASEAALFADAVTPVPVTLPAHASLLTGRVPPQHGVRYNGTFRLEASERTLAEILHERGWRTGAVASSFAVAKRFGLDQGFDDYDDLFDGERGARLAPSAERPAGDVARLGLAWLDREAAKPSFLWLHFYDPHNPYAPPYPFSQSFHDRPYDGEIAFVDQELGKVLAHLRSDAARWKRTLVVIAGDHGEGLYDHGEKSHGMLVYQSTLRVPLLVKVPGARGGVRIAAPVSLVDVLPTVLEALDLPRDASLAGRSLLPLLQGRDVEPRAEYFESLNGSLNFGWSSLEGVRRGSWKYIAGVDPELYDLANDPEESRNVLANEPVRGKEMQEEVDELLAAWKSRDDTPGSAVVHLDPEAAARLASLGYIGVNGGSARREGADPKRLIALEPDLLTAQQAVTDRHWPVVQSTCEFILGKDPDNRLALFYLARAHLEQGRPSDAIGPAEKLAHRYPDFEGGHDLLGTVWRAAGKIDRAVEAYDAGVQLLPDAPSLHFRLSLVLFEAGNRRRACDLTTSALQKWAGSNEFLLLRARCEAAEGKVDAAVATLREVLRSGFDPAPYVMEVPEFGILRRSPEYIRMQAEEAERKKTSVVHK